jgi:ribosomal 50S subunit-associated protein YjgA (DUF615 family)
MTNQNNNDYFNNEKDPLYERIKEDITKGKRLPYREYLKRRTIHYVEHVANEEELEDIRTAFANRIDPRRAAENNSLLSR